MQLDVTYRRMKEYKLTVSANEKKGTKLLQV